MHRIIGRALGIDPTPIIIIVFIIIIIEIIKIILGNRKDKLEKINENIIKQKNENKNMNENNEIKEYNEEKFQYKRKNKGKIDCGVLEKYRISFNKDHITFTKGKGDNINETNYLYKLSGDEILIKYKDNEEWINLMAPEHNEYRPKIYNKDFFKISLGSREKVRLYILQQYLTKNDFNRYIKNEINKSNLFIKELGEIYGAIGKDKNYTNIGEYGEHSVYSGEFGEYVKLYFKNYMIVYNYYNSKEGFWDRIDYSDWKHDWFDKRTFIRIWKTINNLRDKYNIKEYYIGEEDIKRLESFIQK